MNTAFSFADKVYQLYRYPANSQHKTLQAWGSEDEYALTHIRELKTRLGKTLILNDDFGALGCVLHNNDLVWQSDSYVSHQALKRNIERNSLSLPSCILNSTQPLTGAFDTVLIKIPKSLLFLSHQLQQLRAHLLPETRIIATGKVKAISKSVIALFEKTIGPCTTSLAVKKSRLLFCTPHPNTLLNEKDYSKDTLWSLPKSDTYPALRITNLANVFSAQSLDIGARFMLENIQFKHAERVIDLGCGNGVLGLAALASQPENEITFVDESFMAVACAKKNVSDNLPESLCNARFIVDNCLDKHTHGTRQETYDKILCNPPFHQQNTVTDHIAWQMFSDAKKVLRKGGQMIVVGNRHLRYHDKLKRLYSKVSMVASHPKFVILSAIK